MKRKIFMILMILIAVISASAVSSADNVTEITEIEDETISDEVELEDIQENESEDSTVLKADSTESVLGNETSDSNQTSNVTQSKITSSNVVGYTSFKSQITAVLTSNGTALASKNVKIILNGVTYKKVTDKNGKVTLSVKLDKGSYNIQFFYDGDDSTSAANATSKLTVKNAIKTKLKIGDKYINYRQGSKCLFYVKLVDSSGKAIANQQVTIKVNGKYYYVKTNKYGNAKIYLNLKKGTYKTKYAFKKTSPYLASSGSFKIKVRSKMSAGNGYWVWSSHMKKVSLKSLAKKGTKQIFLHVHAISQYGKSSVVSFIKKAHKYGIKVHLWMQVCYSGGKWVRPVTEGGAIKYSFLKSKVKLAKKYAKIKGVDGIHFDYMRFGGTAHKYKNSVKAINYFVKKASTAVHGVKSNCIVSGAIMPEPSSMEYYYGQDVPTISKYLDVLLPMVYKGNYGQTRSWIASVTKTFVSQSNGAQVWTGLQSYHSDSNTKKLSQSSLLKDAKAAKNVGAKGIVLFRYGISCNFNFKKL